MNACGVKFMRIGMNDTVVVHSGIIGRLVIWREFLMRAGATYHLIERSEQLQQRVPG